jgi:hypothetical protein
MKAYKKIEEAKKVLKENGYYVDNLWSVDDVMVNSEICSHPLDEKEAYKILNNVMQSEYIVSTIFEMIDNEITEIKNED